MASDCSCCGSPFRFKIQVDREIRDASACFGGVFEHYDEGTETFRYYRKVSFTHNYDVVTCQQDGFLPNGVTPKYRQFVTGSCSETWSQTRSGPLCNATLEDPCPETDTSDPFLESSDCGSSDWGGVDGGICTAANEGQEKNVGSRSEFACMGDGSCSDSDFHDEVTGDDFAQCLDETATWQFLDSGSINYLARTARRKAGIVIMNVDDNDCPPWASDNVLGDPAEELAISQIRGTLKFQRLGAAAPRLRVVLYKTTTNSNEGSSSVTEVTHVWSGSGDLQINLAVPDPYTEIAYALKEIILD